MSAALWQTWAWADAPNSSAHSHRRQCRRSPGADSEAISNGRPPLTFYAASDPKVARMLAEAVNGNRAFGHKYARNRAVQRSIGGDKIRQGPMAVDVTAVHGNGVSDVGHTQMDCLGTAAGNSSPFRSDYHCRDCCPGCHADRHPAPQV